MMYAECLARGKQSINGSYYGLRSETLFSAKMKGKQEDNFVLKESLGPETLWTMKRSHFSDIQRRLPSPNGQW